MMNHTIVYFWDEIYDRDAGDARFSPENIVLCNAKNKGRRSKYGTPFNLRKQEGLYQKTKHFRERQQERHIPNDALKQILSEIKVSYGGEVRLIVPEKMMKKCKLARLGSNLILVLDANRLVTIFAISSLTEYFFYCRRTMHCILN